MQPESLEWHNSAITTILISIFSKTEEGFILIVVILMQYIPTVLTTYQQNDTIDGVGKHTFKDGRTAKQKQLGALREFNSKRDLQTALSMFADSFSGCASI
jgi:hypothetical protein